MAVLSLMSFLYVLTLWKLSLRLDRNKLKKEVCDKHVVIVGGSNGLGLAMSKELVQAGANITIIARGTPRSGIEDSLKDAREKCESKKIFSSQVVNCTKAEASDYSQMKSAMTEAYMSLGVPHWVINCAGYSLPGMLSEQLPNEIEKNKPAGESMMDGNYFTSLNTIRAVTFLSNKNLSEEENKFNGDMSDLKYPKRIILTGSVLSFMSFVGYSAYSASKYALKGLCDALNTEFLPYNVNVHLCLPGSIDTDSFILENEIKPYITKIIEGKTTPKSPEDVSSCLLGGILKNRTYVTDNVLGEVCRMLGNGITTRPWHLIEALAMPTATITGYIISTFIKRETIKAQGDLKR